MALEGDRALQRSKARRTPLARRTGASKEGLRLTQNEGASTQEILEYLLFSFPLSLFF